MPSRLKLIFKNYSHSLPKLSQYNRTYSENKPKNKCVCIHETTRLIIMKMKIKMKNESHR